MAKHRPSRQMHLNVFLRNIGQHEAAWRLPEARTEDVVNIVHYRHLAREAERGKLDAIFLADHPVLNARSQDRPWDLLDPLILVAALSGVTDHIGLVATGSTTYNDPYSLARRYASLDHVSRGRAAWNVVTTVNREAAGNFGLPAHPDPDSRYARAEEFLEVVLGLWDSWDDDAIRADKSAGVFLDRSKVHRIDHAGDYFQVAGPLEVPRSPQGRPVLFQAGSSGAGQRLAARYADAIFTAQTRLEDAQHFYKGSKAQVAQAGRDPAQVLVLPGISFFLGGTEAQARALQSSYENLILPSYGIAELLRITGEDFSGHDLDATVRIPPRRSGQEHLHSRRELVQDLTDRETLTLRQLLRRLSAGRGHYPIVGTPEQVASELIRWYESGAADGFNLIPPSLPASLTDFVDQVIPILQSRGIFRSDYGGATLRDHLGIDRPATRRQAVPSNDATTV
ncbi:LLM class flavin-dependent oxidoreductase [Bordetella genomosp. 10]|uniref:LLM class flavin-dependent oxidoreductase n=1 Tax=Bordetella genomosp. 10 TaxID=1416804 RepID=A0A261SJ11_9BORD|nr:LLM class flavin-dependent oxidoreductase [Bordetella genomosp. 10]OZI37145.1 LLM class flavin-dependent oxidoreductase [Bordetella genomosp. 10]